MAPLPKSWKPCRTKDANGNGEGDIYYFNFTTGESTWDHPCDDYYKRLYEEEKKKKEIVLKVMAYQYRAHVIPNTHHPHHQNSVAHKTHRKVPMKSVQKPSKMLSNS